MSELMRAGLSLVIVFVFLILILFSGMAILANFSHNIDQYCVGDDYVSSDAEWWQFSHCYQILDDGSLVEVKFREVNGVMQGIRK